jgi:hypothetical protein
MPPAPFWFVEFFKIVGFVLHLIPMGIWFAGLPVAVFCALQNSNNSRFYARRMFGQFPIMMALGINFGIVPLLFLQTTYYKSFYTATILTAWHWIAVIPILIVGYYALYLASFSRQQHAQPDKQHQHNQKVGPIDENKLECNKRSCPMILYGMIASVCLICVGILITNGLTLMVRSDLWAGIMERTNFYGATTGVANNMSDPALWFRLMTMFGLGLLTTAVWSVADSHFLQRKTEETIEYRRWTITLAAILTVLGATVLTIAEWAVKGGSGSEALKTAYPHFGFVVLSAYLVFVSILIAKRSEIFLFAAVLLHLVTLAVFGIIRQIGQNTGTAQFIDVSKLEISVQWSPLIAFLVVFVLGVGLIVWMVRQAVISK